MASVTAPGPGHVEDITATTLVVGTNLDKAPIHQYGGTITPTNAKALSIPLSVEAQRAGGAGKFPRPLFLLKRKGKPPLLAEQKQKGKGKRQRTELTLHYILLQSVTIPARPFIGWSAKLLGTVERLFGDFLASKLGG